MTTVNVLLARLERWPSIDRAVQRNLDRYTDAEALAEFGAAHVEDMNATQVQAARKITGGLDIRLLESPEVNEETIINQYQFLEGLEAQQEGDE